MAAWRSEGADDTLYAAVNALSNVGSEPLEQPISPTIHKLGGHSKKRRLNEPPALDKPSGFGAKARRYFECLQILHGLRQALLPKSRRAAGGRPCSACLQGTVSGIDDFVHQGRQVSAGGAARSPRLKFA